MNQQLSACLACGHTHLTPWARATDLEYFTTSEPYDYLRCDQCESLSINPVPAHKLSEIYPPDYYSYDAAEKPGLARRLKLFFDRRFFRSVTGEVPSLALAALDVGGGSGQQLNVLKTADARVGRTAIVDLDEGAQRGAEAAGHAFHCQRIEDFHADEPFNVILMLNLIEHVADPEAVLRSAAQLLTDDGVVVLQTPNVDSLDARLMRHSNWGGYHCPRHWVLFTRDSLTQCAERAGLEVVRFRYAQGAPFWATSALAWLHRRGVITLSRETPVFGHPLFGPALLLAAAIDIPRSFLFRTSQMVMVLRRAA